MAFNKNFTTEDLENFRILVGNKMKQLKNNIQNFESKTDLEPTKKQDLINNSQQEYANLALLEVKCMAQLSDFIFKDLGNEAH